MQHQKLLHKIELAGLVAMVGLCAPGLNSLLPVAESSFTQNIQAKANKVETTKYPNGKVKQSKTTSFYDNKKTKSIVVKKYNKAGKLTYTKTTTYRDTGKKQKEVIKKEYNNFYKEENTAKRWTNRITETTTFDKKGVKVKTVTNEMPYSTDAKAWKGLEKPYQVIETINYENGRIQKGASVYTEVYFDDGSSNVSYMVYVTANQNYISWSANYDFLGREIYFNDYDEDIATITVFHGKYYVMTLTRISTGENISMFDSKTKKEYIWNRKLNDWEINTAVG